VSEKECVREPAPRPRPISSGIRLVISASLVAATAVTNIPSPVRAAEKLTFLDSGNGFTETSLAIAREAGFGVDVVKMPGSRVLVEFRDRPPEMTCAGGWYRTPEREAFAVFTRAFRLDPPEGAVVVASKAERARAAGGFAALFADASLRFLAYPEGISVGEGFDKLYARRGEVNLLRIAVDYNDRLVIARLLARGRLDVAPGFNESQVEEMRGVAKIEGADLEFVIFPDGPARNSRHLMCSSAVPRRVVDALDHAIVRTTYPLP